MHIEIAKSVIEHLHKMPIDFPRAPNGNEWELLEKPFLVTDEEGKVLAQLMPYGEHIDDIAERIGRDKSELIPLLDSLLHKCWVGREGTKEDGCYRVLSWAPGIIEPWVALCDSPEFGQLLGSHVQKEYADPSSSQFFFGTPPFLRVLPREDAIPHDVNVFPGELLSHIIEHVGNDGIAVTECTCRHNEHVAGRDCDHPREDMCLMFGHLATVVIESGAGRAVTKEEARKIMKRAQDAGLVQHATNCEHGVYLCNCCPCACVSLRAYSRGVPQPAVKSNFYPVLNVELCNGCQTCVKGCPVKAVTFDRKTKKPILDLEKCIGCGICVVSCTSEATRLRRKEAVEVFPHTWDDYLKIRAQQTGRTEFYK